MKKRQIYFSLYALVLVCIFSRCSGLVASGAADSTYDSLGAVESDLYEDGPVDLPVTIAKLESPDANLIHTEIAEISSVSDSLAPSFAAENGSCSTTYEFTVTGDAQSIRDVSKAYVYVPSTGESNIVTLGADGSLGPLSVCTESEVVISAMGADETQVSPPLVFDVSVVDEEDGARRLTPILKDTNSVQLDGNLNVIVDDDGNFYMTLQYEDGSFSLVRKNTDGSLTETLLENLVEEPLQVSVISGDKVVVLGLSGNIFLLTRDAVLGTWSKSDSLIDVGEAGYDSQQLQKYRVLLTSSEDSFLLRKPLIKGEGTSNASLLDLITLTGEVTELVAASDYDDVFIDRGTGNEFHILARSVGALQYTLYKIDAILGAEAWAQKNVELDEFLPDSDWTVKNIDVSENSDVLIHTDGDNVPSQIFLWNSVAGLTRVNDVTSDPFGFYETPHISRDGSLVVLCKIEPPGEVNGGQVAIHRPGIDAIGEIHSVVDDYQVNSYCDPLRQQRFFVDTNGLIHFYQMPILTPAEMQHGMLSAGDIDILNGFF